MTPDDVTPWAGAGLTSKQAWTATHICRCRNCGAWMVATTLHGGPRSTCTHLTPKSATKGQAA